MIRSALAGVALLALAGCAGRKSLSTDPESAPTPVRAVATLELQPELPATASRDVLKGYFDTESTRLLSAPFLRKVLETIPQAVRSRHPESLSSPAAFAAALRAERVGETFLLRVSYVAADPREVLRILDSLLGMFVDDTRQRRGKAGEGERVKVLEPARPERDAPAPSR